ncbi:MAG: hypothetical protein C5B49_16050 [Bdellovibrio sp.]|nr:MAG: hypothetical protein C5B49_16050 [Bdellovibrio sp.]
MKVIALSFGLAASLSLAALAKTSGLPIDQWIARQSPISIKSIEQNINPAGGAPGAVVASPAPSYPDYHFHWVRDGALAFLTVLNIYRAASDPSRQQQLRQNLLDYGYFSASVQTTTNQLGEPKFYLNGQPFTGPWCRPQNDGAALRAITLISFAKTLIINGETSLARANLVPVINNDLNFVKNVWNQPSCDLWEEVSGQHFYTLMVQRRALLDGAAWAEFFGQNASQLTSVAGQITTAILKHWSADKGYLVATLNRTGGLDYKTSNLDAAIILGILHGHTDDGFLSYTDPHVLATAKALLSVFATKFPINQVPGVRGVAIGRYPEDRYAGSNFNGGNPWVLLTAALSRYYYLASSEARKNGHPADAAAYKNQAEDLLLRLKHHAPDDGIWAEQIDRVTGFMTSAPNLTWSHSEVLEAFTARALAGPP